MFAPVAIRFHGYRVECDGIGSAYVDSVLRHPAVQEWMNAGQREIEIIEGFEVGEEPGRQ
jgi:glutathione S-transferase